jgi:hypothetical protein
MSNEEGRSIKILTDGMSDHPIGIPFPFQVGDTARTVVSPDDWWEFVRHYEDLLQELAILREFYRAIARWDLEAETDKEFHRNVYRVIDATRSELERGGRE